MVTQTQTNNLNYCQYYIYPIFIFDIDRSSFNFNKTSHYFQMTSFSCHM